MNKIHLQKPRVGTSVTNGIKHRAEMKRVSKMYLGPIYGVMNNSSLRFLEEQWEEERKNKRDVGVDMNEELLT